MRHPFRCEKLDVRTLGGPFRRGVTVAGWLLLLAEQLVEEPDQLVDVVSTVGGEQNVIRGVRLYE